MTATLFHPGGPLTDKHAEVYVERAGDDQSLQCLHNMNYLMIIEPRQQGKTSLVNHLKHHPSLSDTRLIYADVSTLDRSTEAAWYQSLCSRMLRQLRHMISCDRQPAIPNTYATWRDFLCEIATVATEARQRVIIALDEIGSVAFPKAVEFFSVLREVYNSRMAETEFEQLTFLLVGAFHPRGLIRDEKVSPFNIAQRVRLSDFSTQEIHKLVMCLLRPYQADLSEEQLEERATAMSGRIHDWTNGQPYLTQWMCDYLTRYGAAVLPEHVDAGVSRLVQDDENHLPPILDRLKTDKKLDNYLKRIMQGERIKFNAHENRHHAELELLGVIKADAEGYCTIRNRIYERTLADTAPSSAPADRTAAEAFNTRNTAAIREMLTAAFDDEELSTFCADHFNAVYEEFASGMSKRDKIRRLLDYCVRQEQVETLLAEVRQCNPAQYARFEKRLGK